jgi:hypothetical protein
MFIKSLGVNIYWKGGPRVGLVEWKGPVGTVHKANFAYIILLALFSPVLFIDLFRLMKKEFWYYKDGMSRGIDKISEWVKQEYEIKVERLVAEALTKYCRHDLEVYALARAAEDYKTADDALARMKSAGLEVSAKKTDDGFDYSIRHQYGSISETVKIRKD